MNAEGREGPPTWVDVPFIQEALRQNNININVASVSVTGATALGDNYGSTLYRATATLDDGRLRSLLVKVPPKGNGTDGGGVVEEFFKRETTMLWHRIPALQKLLDDVTCSGFTPFTARCLLHGKEPQPFLVLEDLKPQGFILADRHRGLGLRHSLLAIRTMARFHATSAALLAHDASAYQDLRNQIHQCSEAWKPLLMSTLQMAADACKKWPGYDEYAEILEKFMPNAIKVYTRLNDPNPGRFNVILHGDFWTNNLMFKYDENGLPHDLRMVDFQFSHVASPVIDLINFLNSSLSEDVTQHHQPLLLREYHVALTDTLQLFGINGPSFEELMEDVNSHSSTALLSVLCVWPLTKEVPDTNAPVPGDSSKMNKYETPHIKRWIQYVLPYFKKKGWLNLPSS